MKACSRRIKVLASIIFVCVLLYFGHLIISLMSETEDSFREPDRKKLSVSRLEGRGSNVIERAAALGSPGHEEALATGKKFEYHFRVYSLCL